LNLNQLPNACGAQAIAPNHIAWKLNPGVNFTSRNSTFDLFTPLGTRIDQCAVKSGFPTALIITSSECKELIVNVPAGEISAPFEHWAHFTCDDSGWNVNVEFDECTGGVKYVRCDRLGAECGVQPPPVEPTSNTYGYVVPPPNIGLPDFIDFKIQNMGPGTPGVVICTGVDSEPVYLRGDQAWWCGVAP
jgi:hypothetical protein